MRRKGTRHSLEFPGRVSPKVEIEDGEGGEEEACGLDIKHLAM